MNKLKLKDLIREEIRKALKEAISPKPGQKIDDWDLVDGGYISANHTDEWLDLLSDERLEDGWINDTALKVEVLELVNTWLKKNGYNWQVADALEQNDEGEVTWQIKSGTEKEESFGDQIEKEIAAKILADKRAFQAWAKSAAAKKKVLISFQGPMLVRVALNELYRTGILNDELIDKWKSAPADSTEGQLYSGLTALFASTMKPGIR